MPNPPLVQHVRSVAEFLAAFTAYAVTHLPLTPSDIPDGRKLGATFHLSATALAGLLINLWREAEWDEYKSHATVAGDTATAASNSLAQQQLPADVKWAAAQAAAEPAPSPGSAAYFRGLPLTTRVSFQPHALKRGNSRA